ncbi:MAG: hypothetical protein BroJett011_75390 [Chloroflexota bacterium]|nr:MAG: hypothetical protein BroJett011_75390 [Chloroflexota bacterium]
MYEYELGALPELGEYEGEGEGGLESEYESEEFFRRLAGLARQAVQSPALRRIGLTAARTALRTGLGPQVGGFAGNLLPQAEYEEEFEGEEEGEFEGEGELNPIRRVYPDALMEHLGHAATEAESEAEAEAFIGALIPMAARLVPRVAPAIMRAAPRLIRGVANVTRTLRRSPTTRPLVRTLPTIVRRTAANLAQQVAQGRPVTPRTAVQTLARQTAGVLGCPRQCLQAYRRSRALDRRYHRAVPMGRTPG